MNTVTVTYMGDQAAGKTFSHQEKTFLVVPLAADGSERLPGCRPGNPILITDEAGGIRPAYLAGFDGVRPAYLAGFDGVWPSAAVGWQIVWADDIEGLEAQCEQARTLVGVWAATRREAIRDALYTEAADDLAARLGVTRSAIYKAAKGGATDPSADPTVKT